MKTCDGEGREVGIIRSAGYEQDRGGNMEVSEQFEP